MLRNEINHLRHDSSKSSNTGSLTRSSTRNVQQLTRLCDLFEAKSNDFHQTIATKSQDLQRICSQITQTIADF